jgi:hypothetical protein
MTEEKEDQVTSAPAETEQEIKAEAEADPDAIEIHAPEADDSEVKLCQIGAGRPDSVVGIWDVSDDEYYADKDHLSCSMIMDFVESPRLFEAKHITKTIVPKDDSPALLFGKAFHEALLRPEVYAKMFQQKPKFGRKKADLEAKAKWEAENENSTCLSEADSEKIAAMVESVKRSKLLDIPGERKIEQAARWKVNPGFRWNTDLAPNLESGPVGFPGEIWLKCKYDLVIDDDIIIDVKTIASIGDDSLIAKHIHEYGYHIREQWYLDGAKKIGMSKGKNPRAGYHFLFVSKEPPHDCLMVNLDFTFKLLARQKIADWLQAFYDAVSTDDWRFRGEKEMSVVAPPKWAMLKN